MLRFTCNASLYHFFATPFVNSFLHLDLLQKPFFYTYFFYKFFALSIKKGLRCGNFSLRILKKLWLQIYFKSLFLNLFLLQVFCTYHQKELHCVNFSLHILKKLWIQIHYKSLFLHFFFYKFFALSIKKFFTQNWDELKYLQKKNKLFRKK